jgi:hypothetical protein
MKDNGKGFVAAVATFFIKIDVLYINSAHHLDSHGISRDDDEKI